MDRERGARKDIRFETIGIQRPTTCGIAAELGAVSERESFCRLPRRATQCANLMAVYPWHVVGVSSRGGGNSQGSLLHRWPHWGCAVC